MAARKTKKDSSSSSSSFRTALPETQSVRIKPTITARRQRHANDPERKESARLGTAAGTAGTAAAAAAALRAANQWHTQNSSTRSTSTTSRRQSSGEREDERTNERHHQQLSKKPTPRHRVHSTCVTSHHSTSHQSNQIYVLHVPLGEGRPNKGTSPAESETGTPSPPPPAPR